MQDIYAKTLNTTGHLKKNTQPGINGKRFSILGQEDSKKKPVFPTLIYTFRIIPKKINICKT